MAQQPTVVEEGATGSAAALQLLTQTDPRAHTEPDMHAWLDTHTVFVAAMAALLLHEHLDTRMQRLRAATRLVRAMREAFTALEDAGTQVRPRNLRAIFGTVPEPFAAMYWAIQFTRPVVQVSILPHARTTRTTEQRAVALHALQLVGRQAPRYRTLVDPLATFQ